MAEAARAPERTVYEAGAGRKTALSLAFLILLPFYASLPAMLVAPADSRPVVRHHRPHRLQRAVHGPDGAAGRAALPVAALARGARRHGGRITLPQGSGATPMLRFVNTRDPLRQDRPRSRRARAVRQRHGARAAARHPPASPRTASTCGSATSTRTTSMRPCPSPRSAPRSPSAPASRWSMRGTVRRSIEKRVLGFIGRKTPPEDEPPADRGRDGRDQRPPRARHEIPGGRHGRAGGRRHRHRRVHGAAHLVCRSAGAAAPGGKR